MASYDSSTMSNDTSLPPSLLSDVNSSDVSSSSEGGSQALYIILAIASPIVYACVNIVDKTAVSMRVKHTPSYLVMIGVLDMIIALIIAVCCDWSPEAMKDTTVMDFFIPVISAFCWAASIYSYYVGMLLSDASIIVGIEYIYPLLVVILSVIFLHERIEAMGYVGCVLLVIGASTLSLNLIGIICNKCKKSRSHQEENKERSLVLGNGYGPFQQALIPAGSAASITNAGSTEEARAAFIAILNWRGDFVMPIMEKPKVKKIEDTYVDVEAGCAPGVSCWFPCATWCSNCQKVVGTKSDKKEGKKKNKEKIEDEEPEKEEETTTEDGAEKKKKKIDSRKSLESTRNARVRRASVAAVNATVNRPTPEYDSVVAEKKEEEKKEEESTGVAVVAEEKKDVEPHHHHRSSSHHHHSSSHNHHHSSSHHHGSSSHHHHSSSRHHHSHSSHHKSSTQKQQLHSDDEDDEDDVEDEDKLDDDAIPLEEVGRDKKKDEEEEESEDDEDEEDDDDDDDDDEDDDDDDDDDDDEEEELSDSDNDDNSKRKATPDEEKNCVTTIVAWCNKRKDSKLLLIIALIPLVVFLALTEFLAKVATAKLNTFNVCSINFFAYGFFMFSIIFVTPFKGAKYFISELKQNWLFCTMSDVLTLTGQFLLIFAMSGMSASVVSSLAAIQPLCCLCLERVFGIASDSLKDCLTYKLVPIIIIVTGVVLLSLAVV